MTKLDDYCTTNYEIIFGKTIHAYDTETQQRK